MLQKFGAQLEQRLLPRSKMLFAGLITANVCLGLWLNATTGEAVVPAPSLQALEGPEIQLLAEIAPPAEAVPKPPVRECRIWGPEKSPDLFAELQANLDAIGGFPEIQETEVRAAPDYLVYVTGLGSRDNAKRAARELKALNIDSYAMTSESGAPILSVGLFSRENLAVKQEERVAKLGYEVVLETLERTQTVYNLVAHVRVDSDEYQSSTSACVAIAQSK